MSIVDYKKGMFVERIRKHCADGFPNSDFTASTKEILLYLDSALAFGLVGQVYQNAKVEGNMPSLPCSKMQLPGNGSLHCHKHRLTFH
jgi:hypothetical protein